MKQYTIKCFDDFIMGATAVHTSSDFNPMLGMADQISFQLACDGMTSGTGNVAVRLEHSNDGRNWTEVSGTDVVSVSWSVSTATASGFGSFTGSTQVLGAFVRAKLTASTGNVHAVLYATGRGAQ